MAGVILDSSVVIYAERLRMNESHMLEVVRSRSGEQVIALSAVGVTEVAHGIYRADSQARAERRRTFLHNLIADLPVFPYTLEIALLAGQIDGEQQAIGNTIPFVDLMIGATALHLNYSILTANLRHFRQIPNLVVIPF